MNIDIGEVITRAWHISWKNKSLWVIGIIIVMTGFMFLPLLMAPMLADLVRDPQVDEALLPLLFIGGFILYILVLYPIAALLNIALTQGILHAERGDEKRPIMELIRESYPYFWPYLRTMILFIGGTMLFFLAFFILTSLFSFATFGLGMMCLIPLSFLQYPAMLIWYILMEQSMTAVITNNMGARESARHSWQLFKKNIWVYVVIGLVFYFGISLLSSFVMMPFMFPFVFLPILIESGEIPRIAFILIGLVVIIFTPVFLIFQGALMTLMKSGWVITYLRLTRSTEQLTPELQTVIE